MIYMVISFFIFLLVAWFVPKRCNPIALYGAILTGIFLEVMIVLYLDKGFDLLGFLTYDTDYAEILISYGIFPLFYAVFLNLFPYGKAFVHKVGYMIVVVVFCMLYERGALLWGMLYYHGWKWEYSFLMYSFLLTILAWNYDWLQERIKFDYER